MKLTLNNSEVNVTLLLPQLFFSFASLSCVVIQGCGSSSCHGWALTCIGAAVAVVFFCDGAQSHENLHLAHLSTQASRA